MRAKGFRAGDSLRRKVDGDNTTTGGAGDLDGQHTNEARADYRDGLADADLGLSQALERDGANGRQRGGFGGNLRGDMNREIARHKVDFSMVGVRAAGTSYAVSRAKLFSTFADGNNFAGTAIA